MHKYNQSMSDSVFVVTDQFMKTLLVLSTITVKSILTWKIVTVEDCSYSVSSYSVHASVNMFKCVQQQSICWSVGVICPPLHFYCCHHLMQLFLLLQLLSQNKNSSQLLLEDDELWPATVSYDHSLCSQHATFHIFHITQ